MMGICQLKARRMSECSCMGSDPKLQESFGV